MNCLHGKEHGNSYSRAQLCSAGHLSVRSPQLFLQDSRNNDLHVYSTQESFIPSGANPAGKRQPRVKSIRFELLHLACNRTCPSHGKTWGYHYHFNRRHLAAWACPAFYRKPFRNTIGRFPRVPQVSQLDVVGFSSAQLRDSCRVACAQPY